MNQDPKTLMQSRLAELVEKLAAKAKAPLKRKLQGVTVVEVDGQSCVRIPLTKSMFAIADMSDAEKLLSYCWHVVKGCKTSDNLWYAVRWVGTEPNRKLIRMHHVILPPDLDTEIDHRNGDGLDNRSGNLRRASHCQNVINRKTNFSSKSGFKGVTRSANGKWRARIGFGGLCKQIGTFPNKEDAAIAYHNAAMRIHGEFVRQNLPVNLTPG